MASRIWILGASDPEMAAIEALLSACGETFAYATVGGIRAHAGNAYMADPQYQYDRIDGDLYLIECAVVTECGAHTVHTIDHHRPGDAGFGVEPAGFLRASSLGQVISELAKLDVLPATWYRAGASSRPGSAAGFCGTLEYDCYAECWNVVDRHRATRPVPIDLVLTAAADHCLGHAYAGRCPGVDPDELMHWRVESRAKFQGRSVDEILADVEAARKMLEDRSTTDVAWLDPGECSDPQCSCCDGPTAVDMRGIHVPELPEAGTRYGIAYVADGLPGPDGRRKVVCSGTAEVIRAFLTSFVTREGLVDPYGDPARGFAGAYYPA